MPDNNQLPYQYIGWVPCLSGDMFFRYTEPGLGDCDIVSINHHSRDLCSGRGRERFIIATSQYDLKDSGDPTQSGIFRAVVAGTAENRDEFKGKLYFISHQSRMESEVRKKAKHEIQFIKGIYLLRKNLNSLLPQISDGDLAAEQDASEILRNAVVLPTPESQIGQGFNIHDAITKITEKYVYIIDFVIDNTGFAKLRYDTNNSTSGKFDNEEQDLIDAKIHHHQYVICRQGFYYIKCLLHRHTHHDHYNDSLTTVHLINHDPIDNSRDLIRDLKRGLVDLKRARKFDKRDTAGIASYGKSLVASCHANNCGDGENNGGWLQKELAYFSNLSESILLRADTYSTIRQKLKGFLSAIQRFLTIIFLFFTPLLLIAINITKNQSAAGPDQRGHKFQGCEDSFFSVCDINKYVVHVTTGDPETVIYTYLTIFFVAILGGLVLGKTVPFSRGMRALEDWLRHNARCVGIPWWRIDLIIVFLINRLRVRIRNAARALLRPGRPRINTAFVIVIFLVVMGSSYFLFSLGYAEFLELFSLSN